MADPVSPAPKRKMTQQEIDHQRKLEEKAAEANIRLQREAAADKAQLDREQLQAEAKARQAKADAEAEAARIMADAARAEAQARADAIRAANDPKVLEAKQAAELRKAAAEADAARNESFMRMGMQAGAVGSGLVAGHTVAHWIEKRNAKAFEEKQKVLKELASNTKSLLDKADKRLEAAGQPTTDPKGKKLDSNTVKKHSDAMKALTTSEQKRLIGNVRAFDTQRLTSVKGPMGWAMAGLFAADALFSRHMASATKDDGAKRAKEARSAAQEARAKGNPAMADHLEMLAKSHEQNAKSASLAWDLFGTANWFAAGSQLATRAVQRETLGAGATVNATRVGIMEAAREAAGLSAKTAVQAKVIAQAIATKGSLVSNIFKAVASKGAARLLPVVGAVLVANDLYSKLQDAGGKVEKGGATSEGGPQKIASMGGTEFVREHARVNQDGSVSMVKEHIRHRA